MRIYACINLCMNFLHRLAHSFIMVLLYFIYFFLSYLSFLQLLCFPSQLYPSTLSLSLSRQCSFLTPLLSSPSYVIAPPFTSSLLLAGRFSTKAYRPTINSYRYVRLCIRTLTFIPTLVCNDEKKHRNKRLLWSGAKCSRPVFQIKSNSHSQQNQRI